MGRCVCILASGPRKDSQCSNQAKPGSQFCGVHKNCKKIIDSIQVRQRVEPQESQEKQRMEKQRVEKQRVEKQRVEKQRVEKQRVEKQRVEKQRVEKQRVEEQNVEKQHVEKQHVEKQLAEQQGILYPKLYHSASLIEQRIQDREYLDQRSALRA